MAFVDLSVSRSLRFFASAGVAIALLGGCKSKQDQAIDQAKQQAARTGQAQQVVTTDKDTTTTTVVQPPASGQTTQAITTTTTKTTSGSVTAANSQPVVTPAQNVAGGTPAPAVSGAGPASVPVAPAAVPVPLDVRVAAGTSLVIRINQRISVKTSHAGDRFSGEIAEGVTGHDANAVLIPKGTPVYGVVDASHRRGHFKGRSILELRLTSMRLNGQRYALDTHDLVTTKKGKGKRSAGFIGGGAGVGMLIGGIATGGVGLVVGGLAGGGAGTALAGLTGNRDLDIPAESLIRFRLADALVVTGPANE